MGSTISQLIAPKQVAPKYVDFPPNCNPVQSEFSIDMTVYMIGLAATPGSQLATAVADYLRPRYVPKEPLDFGICNFIFTRSAISRELDLKIKDSSQITLASLTSANEINGMVSEVTKGMIKNVFAEDEVKNSSLIIASIIYFDQRWTHYFGSPERERFNCAIGQTYNVWMMSKKDEVPHQHFKTLRGIKCCVVDIPYRNGSLMRVVLPDNILDHKVMADLMTPADWRHLEQLMLTAETFKLDIQLPQWYNVNRIELTDQLRALFPMLDTPGQLDGFFPNDQSQRIGRIIQQASIEVTPYGTKAAAFTAASIERCIDLARPKSFICNHPFSYALIDRNIRLFTGYVTHPPNA